MARKTNTLTRKTKGFASKRKALGAPDIDSMFDQTGLEGLPPNSAKTLQESADKEVDDMMASIRENRKNHAERFRDIESGEFWLCVCFQSRTQKEEFIDKLLEKYDPNNETFGTSTSTDWN